MVQVICTLSGSNPKTSAELAGDQQRAGCMTRCLSAGGGAFRLQLSLLLAFPNPPSPSPSPQNHHRPRLMPPPSRAHCRPPCRKKKKQMLPSLPSPHLLLSLPAPHPHSSCPRALRRWQHAVRSMRAALRHNCRMVCGVSYVCNNVGIEAEASFFRRLSLNPQNALPTRRSRTCTRAHTREPKP